jgi:hypothetical protein
MTAAGIAFIAGGLATLISLRSVLFGGGKRRERDRPPAKRAAAGAARRPPLPDIAETAQLEAVKAEDDTRPREIRRARRHAKHPDDLPGSLASIGLAAEEECDPHPPAEEKAEVEAVGEAAEQPPPPAEPPAEPRAEPLAEPRAEPLAEPLAEPPPVTLGDEESRPISVRRIDRTDRAYGDRVAGWVRPEYHDDPVAPPSGEYWTPVPLDDLGFDLVDEDAEPSARGYGWPTPVERLPAVPDYEPSTGFDLAPVTTEPTELVPSWPPMPDERPGRIHLPRSWTNRNEKSPGRAEPPAGQSEKAIRIEKAGRKDKADNRFFENESPARRRVPAEDAEQRFRAPTGEPERRRPRPRPRPAGSHDNVYVSRHAADPPH